MLARLHSTALLALLLACAALSPGASATAARVTVEVDWQQPAGQSRMAVGATHEHRSLDSWGDPAAIARARALLQASTAYQNQHIMGWGAGNPEPAPGVYDWADLDRRVQLMRDTGAVKVLTLCCAPDWMKGLPAGATDWSALEVAPLPGHVADFAELCRRVALRYPDVEYFQVWNEMKGLWAPALNRWDYERYTALYNAVYDAVKGARPDAQLGGPYVVLDSWGDRAAMSHPSGVGGPYGTLDQRPLDAISYWLANKRGADFITVDASTRNWDGVATADPFAATQKFADAAAWIASQTDLPLWWGEWYAWGTSEADAREANAVMATALARMVESGASVALMWRPQGNENGVSFPAGLFTDTERRGGGKATPYFVTQSSFKEYFRPGTTFYNTVASSPAIRGLATAEALVLINTTPGSLTVEVEGRVLILGGYDVAIWRYPAIPRVREIE